MTMASHGRSSAEVAGGRERRAALKAPPFLFALVFARQQDCQDACGDRRVCRIGRSAFEEAVVVVDLPEDIGAFDGEGAEIVLAMRIVVGREILEGASPD